METSSDSDDDDIFSTAAPARRKVAARAPPRVAGRGEGVPPPVPAAVAERPQGGEASDGRHAAALEANARAAPPPLRAAAAAAASAPFGAMPSSFGQEMLTRKQPPPVPLVKEERGSPIWPADQPVPLPAVEPLDPLAPMVAAALSQTDDLREHLHRSLQDHASFHAHIPATLAALKKHFGIGTVHAFRQQGFGLTALKQIKTADGGLLKFRVRKALEELLGPPAAAAAGGCGGSLAAGLAGSAAAGGAVAGSGVAAAAAAPSSPMKKRTRKLVRPPGLVKEAAAGRPSLGEAELRELASPP